MTIIYLLFNEGYYSSVTEKNTRKHLCLEAMALLLLFLRSFPSAEANALMALFCFHASRFEARQDDLGNSVLYEDQDTSKWSAELIEKGEEYLNRSATGPSISKYHIEATIAFWHARISDETTKWENILQLYTHLLQVDYSPIAALNRTYALSKVKGKKKALAEALKINLSEHHLYHALLAELYHEVDNTKAKDHLTIALSLTKTESEKDVLLKKMRRIKTK